MWQRPLKAELVYHAFKSGFWWPKHKRQTLRVSREAQWRFSWIWITVMTTSWTSTCMWSVCVSVCVYANWSCAGLGSEGGHFISVSSFWFLLLCSAVRRAAKHRLTARLDWLYNHCPQRRHFTAPCTYQADRPGWVRPGKEGGRTARSWPTFKSRFCQEQSDFIPCF